MKRRGPFRVPQRIRPQAKRLYYWAETRGHKRRRIAGQLRSQAEICRSFSSPFYGWLLDRAAEDVAGGGACWSILETERPTALGADDALPLRFMGAMHRLVLDGRADGLAAHYPSAGGDGDAEAAWPAFRATAAENVDLLRRLLQQTVQTNEVGRCAVLAGGFLLVARRTGLPLYILEIGSSAGLNLRWDRYRYECRGAAWGELDSPVKLGAAIVSGRPPYDTEATVVGRAGCDLAPIDPSSEDGRLTLTSLVWADQAERLALLRGALEVAKQVPAEVEPADAASWLERELATTRAGVATVVFHSFVMQFLDEAERRRIDDAFAGAASRATETCPLAWLRMEWGAQQAEVRLTMWPSGTEELIATAAPHGTDVHWLAPAT